ncbi:hypothetical protein AO1008_03711 [Aspergillus oryzae 100-8]|uniref:Zn(2)-C6 fungal-type domain-containing protein n=1 Tax=Aspergillus oryzae (strain 3.042) TaxID=1160506 RepID=I8IV68_ASPO3|nr:hypothetical protein Ao3042_11338 [Aspergillus oryzae 3.042]KDE85897.1 hypothetical protein AO1008_03711 [Aspergillus oryzae 100-8]|eukprot:EIT83381.1 hypothetical protein Ao3042_11338 [Aspergillus oryzae 3.042]
MAARQSTPMADHSHSDNVRKRVCKACDRCRLKKSKVCASRTEGETVQSLPSLVFCSYVEMLEQQQAWLVHGLKELYRRTIEAEGWPGDSLKPERNGHPLTHDLLTRLGALDNTKDERFEENQEVIAQELWRHDLQLREFSDGSSDSAHSPVASSRFPSDASPSSHQTMAPTPSTYSPSTRPAPTKQHALSMHSVVNPLALQGGPQQWPGSNGFHAFNEMDLMTTADYANLNFDDPIPSPIYRPIPVDCVQSSDYGDFNQFLNPNLTGITSV